MIPTPDEARAATHAALDHIATALRHATPEARYAALDELYRGSSLVGRRVLTEAMMARLAGATV